MSDRSCRLLASGLHQEDIARRLGITVTTVRNHTQSILGKLDVHSKLEAVAVGMRAVGSGWHAGSRDRSHTLRIARAGYSGHDPAGWPAG